MICEEIDHKICFFKFGLKYLILLKDFLYKIEDEESLYRQLFYLGIQNKQDWAQLYRACPNPKKLILLSLNFSFNLDGSFEDVRNHILQMDLSKLERLYSILVGEVGVLPSEFYQMTPHEADLAYEGFLKRKELEANCMMLAIREALKSQASPIVLLDDLGYHKSSLEEREKTFNNLKIGGD